MLDARFPHLYFYQSLNRLQHGLSAIAELLVALRSVKLVGTLNFGIFVSQTNTNTINNIRNCNPLVSQRHQVCKIFKI